MILGIDHIALSCENIIHGVNLLGKMGYRAKFIQEYVPNNPAKTHFLMSYDPLHSLAYCQIENGISIELTQHSSPLRNMNSPYQVLLNSPSANLLPFDDWNLSNSWDVVWCAALGCDKPVAALWRLFHAQFWYNSMYNESSSGFIRGILVPVDSLTVAEKFWCRGLGCRVVNRGMTADGRRWGCIAFRAPIPAWSVDIILAESDVIPALSFMDDAGFPCLAIITNRIDEDRDRAMEMGGQDASEKFALEIGGKMLEIIVMRGPYNELVELIEFQRN